MAKQLRRAGHDVHLSPMLEIVADPAWPLRLGDLRPAAVIVTSANAVQAEGAPPLPAALADRPALCVGARTAAAAKAAGFRAATAPGEGGAEALVAWIVGHLDPAAGMLLHLGGRDRAGDVDGRLQRNGFAVTTLETYRAEARTEFSKETAALLSGGGVDLVVTASARTSAAFLACLRAGGQVSRLAELAIVAISAAAAAPLVEAGARHVHVPDAPTGAALGDLVLGLADRRRGVAANPDS
ncbi:uroporphyrinogen-III synthase [Methylobrevis pamukkalensis]|nr:uroporphyrinogen-III synthase [Methylobrevis pamukkalensis]